MLDVVIIVLVLLWALGYFGGFVVSGLVHLLLVVALVVLIARLLSGRRIL